MGSARVRRHPHPAIDLHLVQVLLSNHDLFCFCQRLPQNVTLTLAIALRKRRSL